MPTTLGTFGAQLVAANWGDTAWADLHLQVRVPAPDSLASGLQSDLPLENGRTGGRVIWQMKGVEIATSLSLPTLAPAWLVCAVIDLPTFYAGWRFAGAGFHTVDGRSNIVLQNSLSGERVLWARGVAGDILGSTGLPTLPAEWRFAGIGDSNGDGLHDLLLENTSTGDRVLWMMNNSVIGGGAELPALAAT